MLGIGIEKSLANSLKKAKENLLHRGCVDIEKTLRTIRTKKVLFELNSNRGASMFNFKNLTPSEHEDETFNPADYELSAPDFLEKRREALRPYVFDLRTPEEYDASHLTGAYSLPMEHFEDAIYQLPYEGDILLYGGGNQEAVRAAEILYENGFDTFVYIEDYNALLHSLANSNFTITEPAQKEIQRRLTDSALKAFRIVAKPISPKKAKYRVGFVPEGEDVSKDTLLQVGDFAVHVDEESLLFLEETTVDYDESVKEKLTIRNPQREVPPLTGSEKEMMERLLEEQINPMVAMHGGTVDLIDIKDNRVYLEFGGGCKGCGMVGVTLKQGVEVLVKENIPGIEEILDVTEHADGTNPYYQPGK